MTLVPDGRYTVVLTGAQLEAAGWAVRRTEYELLHAGPHLLPVGVTLAALQGARRTLQDVGAQPPRDVPAAADAFVRAWDSGPEDEQTLWSPAWERLDDLRRTVRG